MKQLRVSYLHVCTLLLNILNFCFLERVCMNEWTEQRDSLSLSQLTNRVFFLNFFLTLTRFGSALIIIKKYYKPLWMTVFICLKIRNMEKMYVKMDFFLAPKFNYVCFGIFCICFYYLKPPTFFSFAFLVLLFLVCSHFSHSCLSHFAELMLNEAVVSSVSYTFEN